MNEKRISSALLSVFCKDGLDKLALRLGELGVRLYSTGGTYDYLRRLGLQVEAVETITSFPAVLGGRVKTLHPHIFGGILGRRDNPDDVGEMKRYQIPEIDLVVVDLYPFSDTVLQGATEQEIIEKIDIGGVSLIRAAAKNYRHVMVVADRSLYDRLIAILDEKNGLTGEEERLSFATEAFRVTSAYDADIFSYFNRGGQINALRITADDPMPLRYGENPHQKAVFYGNLQSLFEQLHGKELSYNNLLDIDAAFGYISGAGLPEAVIIKHNNACGMASGNSLLMAWTKALAGDPLSAFGGVIIVNRSIDTETAEEINKIFFEVIIAPGYEPGSLEILKQKKNRVILLEKSMPAARHGLKMVLNGYLWQERDTFRSLSDGYECVTTRRPSPEEIDDLDFANRVVMNTRSNAIAVVKGRQLIGSGVGQTSRVDAVKQAVEKARSFGFDTRGAVMASDAYFPFSDSLAIAADAGISSVIQPGGSVRDNESVDMCNKHGMAMIFTGRRHFKH